MTQDLDTLLTALYVKIDNELEVKRCMGRPPRPTDSELVCLAVAQALPGFTSEARWMRFAHARLGGMFPYLPRRPGYNKRLRAALPLINQAVRLVAADTAFWAETMWLTDSTPVECARSRPAVKRSNLAGWAGDGYCRSHSRFSWGLGLFLVCTPQGMPITWAPAGPKVDEREVPGAMLEAEPRLAATRTNLLLIADKGFASRRFEAELAHRGVNCCGPRSNEKRTAPASIC